MRLVLGEMQSEGKLGSISGKNEGGGGMSRPSSAGALTGMAGRH